MIDPNDVTNYNRSLSELEEFYLFCCVVAGKTAHIQAKKLDEFLSDPYSVNYTPFEYIANLHAMNLLEKRLREVKLGQYKRLTRTFNESRVLDLHNATVGELEAIPGVGPKTARFFVMHTRPNARVATLDTHILRWMREELDIQTPKLTPSGKKYMELENKFLEYCENKKRDPAELDLEIWKMYSRKVKDESQ